MNTNSSSENEKTAKNPGKREKDNSAGEALFTCSDTEWDASDEPYSAELLNVKKKPNRVSVFTATHKPAESIIIAKSPPAISKKETPEFHSLARLIFKTCEMFLESGSNSTNAQLHIRMEFPDWRNEK